MKTSLNRLYGQVSKLIKKGGLKNQGRVGTLEKKNWVWGGHAHVDCNLIYFFCQKLLKTFYDILLTLVFKPPSKTSFLERFLT